MERFYRVGLFERVEIRCNACETARDNFSTPIGEGGDRGRLPKPCRFSVALTGAVLGIWEERIDRFAIASYCQMHMSEISHA